MTGETKPQTETHTLTEAEDANHLHFI